MAGPQHGQQRRAAAFIFVATSIVGGIAWAVVEFMPSARVPTHSVMDADVPAGRNQAGIEPFEPGVRERIAEDVAVAPASPGGAGVDPWSTTVESAPADEVWQSIHETTDALVFGSVSQAELVTLAMDLVSWWDPDLEPRIESEGGVLAYELSVDSMSSVVLRVTKDPALLAHRDQFTIQTDYLARPGAFVEDGSAEARPTSLQIGFSLGASGTPRHLGGLAQHSPRHTRSLWEHLEATGEPAPLGGSFDALPEGVTWRPIVIENAGNPGAPAFTSTIMDPQVVEGGLADPMLIELRRRLLMVDAASR